MRTRLPESAAPASLERSGPYSGADPTLRVGLSLPSRAWSSRSLHPARACGLSGRLPPESHALYEAGLGAFLHQLPQPREALCGHGKACAHGGGGERVCPVQDAPLRCEYGHPIFQAVFMAVRSSSQTFAEFSTSVLKWRRR